MMGAAFLGVVSASRPADGGGAGPAYGLHRYWRVFMVTNQGGSTDFALANLELRESIGGPNLATTPASALAGSVLNSSYRDDYAFDGRPVLDTFWSTGGASQSDPANRWIGYDFGPGNERQIVEVQLTQRADGFAADHGLVTGSVDYSDDGVTWTTAFSISATPTWDALPASRVFTEAGEGSPNAGSAKRYWRVRGFTNVSGGSTRAISCTALEFRSVASGPNVATGGTAIADSQFNTSSTYTPLKAFDANASTFWIASNGTGTYGLHWIGYDFGPGADVSVVEFAYTKRSDSFGENEAPLSGDVQWSTDGIIWFTEWAWTTTAPWGAGAVQRVFTKP